MAKMVLLGSHITIAGNDLSQYCSKIELTAEVEDKDVTTFTSLGWKEVLGGLASAQLALGFKNDYGDGLLDAILWSLFRTRPTFAVRADNAPVSVSNPQYQGSVLVKEWKPIMGSVGDVAEADVSWTVSGAVTRVTA